MITQLSSNLTAVEVPVDAEMFKIIHTPFYKIPELKYKLYNTNKYIALSEGNYEILGEWIKEDGLSIYRPLGNTDTCTIDSLDLKQKGCILTPENKFVILKQK